ncbi:protease pro-enzyme activation domain-containing protein [Actinomycetospora sp. TBRC 11914]|uniref:S53 family peptidase n=1 Tax=Actinomycetospora sp. TBRC 11914 TaxID=2729387 RepID=UPI00145C4EBE|nr:S53 family peptidase [Actinomycetospora sp. TBRC 11914]NMO90371.1 S8/S53 family peptidase [Actinomycetospora sp. TBRC 11914]
MEDVAPDDRVSVTVVLRRRADADLGAVRDTDPAERRRRFAELAGADPHEADAVERYLEDAGLEVSTDLARRTVTATGTTSQAQAAFGVSLGRYQAHGATYRGREGQVQLPAQLAEYATAVLGLDDRRQGRAHLQQGDTLSEDDLPDLGAPASTLLPDPPAVAAHAATVPKPQPLWTTQVAELYDFPTDVDGSGQTIAILEFGGGYTDPDLDGYFTKIGVKRPKILSVGVDGGKNSPGQDADGEVLLDIEVAATIAQKATIAVYFAPNSDQGFVDAISTAVHDSVNNPSVVSISWGGPEDDWTVQARTAMEEAFADAAALGVTVLCAAGDHGAGDASRRRDGERRVDYPAASPHVVACGGTALIGASSQITAETVWNDHDGWATGGGVSRIFPTPHWQRIDEPGLLLVDGFAGRGVPDVAGNADIATGYVILVHGNWGPVGGTSAVAPLYAGLVALINQATPTPIGAQFPISLYAASASQLDGLVRDITAGDNSTPKTGDLGPAVTGYQADKGWDPCTGHGSVRGRGLRDFFVGSLA